MSILATVTTGLVSKPVAAPSFAGLVQGLSALEIPEPGMMLLFGLSVGLLGLRLGGRRKD
jgi:PEP-CTERM motif